MITHTGGCHCGRVRFEVDAPAELSIDECNCSMCSRTGYLHLIVTADRFRITQGARRADHLHLQHRHGRSTCSARPAASSRFTCRARIRMASA